MFDLDDMNHSELVLLAQDQDPEAHRGMSRAKLIKTAEGQHAPLPQRQINKVRLRIMTYIVEHWQQLKPLLDCPAQTEHPRACFRCTDVQVSECALTNLQIFKKKD